MDNIKTDSYYKNLILSDIQMIKEYSNNVSHEAFINDALLIDAILFRLIQIVENIKNLSQEFLDSHKDIPWKRIIGFRNRIVHDYGKTDYTIVYEIISDDLNSLEEVFK